MNFFARMCLAYAIAASGAIAYGGGKVRPAGCPAPNHVLVGNGIIAAANGDEAWAGWVSMLSTREIDCVMWDGYDATQHIPQSMFRFRLWLRRKGYQDGLIDIRRPHVDSIRLPVKRYFACQANSKGRW